MCARKEILKSPFQQVPSSLPSSPHRDPVFTPDAAVLTNAFRTPSSFPFSTSGLLFMVRLVRLGRAIPLFRRIGIIEPGLVGVAGIPVPSSLTAICRIGVLLSLPPEVLGFL